MVERSALTANDGDDGAHEKDIEEKKDENRPEDSTSGKDLWTSDNEDEWVAGQSSSESPAGSSTPENEEDERVDDSEGRTESDTRNGTFFDEKERHNENNSLNSLRQSPIPVSAEDAEDIDSHTGTLPATKFAELFERELADILNHQAPGNQAESRPDIHGAQMDAADKEENLPSNTGGHNPHDLSEQPTAEYLTGLAAVLQAAQQIQGQEHEQQAHPLSYMRSSSGTEVNASSRPPGPSSAFHPLNIDPVLRNDNTIPRSPLSPASDEGIGFRNSRIPTPAHMPVPLDIPENISDISDFLVQLAAQLEAQEAVEHGTPPSAIDPVAFRYSSLAHPSQVDFSSSAIPPVPPPSAAGPSTFYHHHDTQYAHGPAHLMPTLPTASAMSTYYSPFQALPNPNSHPPPTAITYSAATGSNSPADGTLQSANSNSPPAPQKSGKAKSKGKGRGKGKGKQQVLNSDFEQNGDNEQQTTARLNCEFCGKVFTRSNDRVRHEKIHTKVRPFVCEVPECGKTFIQRSALLVHQRVHSGEKPHKCDFDNCHRSFGDSSALARHRKSHVGVRPHSCRVSGCGKSFTRRTTLAAHVYTKHNGNWGDSGGALAKKRRLTGGEEEDDEEEDVDVDKEIEESVRTLTSLLARANRGGGGGEGNDGGLGNGVGDGALGSNGKVGEQLESRVAAISAEIAAAIAHAQARLADEVDDDELDEESGSDDDAGFDMLGPLVSGIRDELLRPTRREGPSATGNVVGNVSHRAVAGQGADGGAEDEIDFPVSLRERRVEGSQAVGQKRKR